MIQLSTENTEITEKAREYFRDFRVFRGHEVIFRHAAMPALRAGLKVMQ
ncbi:hypothetical protein [Noviherbaspirillum sp.]|nr:hypothetical protein [Noviherbaspirillum sp.]HJV79660.1 hypothetical protein [Noviherbaspirillum sp.]